MLLSASSALRLRGPTSALRPPPLARLAPPASISYSRGAACDAAPVLVSQPPDAALLARSSAAPPYRLPALRRDPELGLLSLLFVLSVAVCSFFSLAIISLPALNAFRRLKLSTEKLSKVVSEEVPGTLSSLKLSSLEINDLTSQLKNLRQRISGNQNGKKSGTTRRSSPGGRRDSITT